MARTEQAFRFDRLQDQQELCYVQGVRAQGLLFLSGISSLDAQGCVLYPGDMAGQARYIYGRIREMLKSQGIQFEDLVKEAIYTTNMEAWRKTCSVRHEVFAGMVPPAGTVVEVIRLFEPGLLLEIEAVAQLPRVP